MRLGSGGARSLPPGCPFVEVMLAITLFEWFPDIVAWRNIMNLTLFLQ